MENRRIRIQIIEGILKYLLKEIECMSERNQWFTHMNSQLQAIFFEMNSNIFRVPAFETSDLTYGI